MSSKPKVGGYLPVWWETGGGTYDSGHYKAKVYKVYPYTGRYDEWFSWIARVEAPGTIRGWMEIAL